MNECERVAALLAVQRIKVMILINFSLPPPAFLIIIFISIFVLQHVTHVFSLLLLSFYVFICPTMLQCFINNPLKSIPIPRPPLPLSLSHLHEYHSTVHFSIIKMLFLFFTHPLAALCDLII